MVYVRELKNFYQQDLIDLFQQSNCLLKDKQFLQKFSLNITLILICLAHVSNQLQIREMYRFYQRIRLIIIQVQQQNKKEEKHQIIDQQKKNQNNICQKNGFFNQVKYLYQYLIMLLLLFNVILKIFNIIIDLNHPDPPSFRKLNVNLSQERLCIIQFRAFRTMQVITDNRNNFLLTRVNKEFYQRAYSMLYKCLKQDLVAITICPEIIIQYSSFPLYQQLEMSTFFLIFYNIPYRLMLFLGIPEISQFFAQLMNILKTPLINQFGSILIFPNFF
ncbi:unnamed protein product [Paramecium pentaurelia]|uniref:Transmembrane protein n=1 Tax=Paramecium pentaurelia TaxID=43138 RepID=A0A8S1S348_9CILI|nr:unnamed protein product [Paramecium pentaurelia]